MNVYLAGPIFKPHHVQVIENLILMCNQMKMNFFSPYHASRDIWKGRAPKDCTPDERQQVLQQNIDKLRWCDVLVAWINRDDDGYDGRPDTGVTWEMGYARALRDVSGTHPITIAYVEESLPLHKKGINLMLTGTVDAVALTEAELLKALHLVKLGEGYRLGKQLPPTRDVLQEHDPVR